MGSQLNKLQIKSIHQAREAQIKSESFAPASRVSKATNNAAEHGAARGGSDQRGVKGVLLVCIAIAIVVNVVAAVALFAGEMLIACELNCTLISQSISVNCGTSSMNYAPSCVKRNQLYDDSPSQSMQ